MENDAVSLWYARVKKLTQQCTFRQQLDIFILQFATDKDPNYLSIYVKKTTISQFKVNAIEVKIMSHHNASLESGTSDVKKKAKSSVTIKMTVLELIRN